jgi:hypothetical protein
MKPGTRLTWLLLASCLLAAVPPALAGPGDQMAHVTIYDAGVAQFFEERTVQLQPGINTVEWRSLMPRANLRTLRVTIDGADVVRQEITKDGPEVGDERAPVLHLVLDNKGAAGPRTVRVDYLAPGLTWHSEHALVLDSKPNGAPPTSATLDSWITVLNSTSTDLAARTVDLIAGEIALDGARRRGFEEALTQNAVSVSPGVAGGGELGAEVSGLSVFNRLALGRDLRFTANAEVSRFPLVRRATLAVEERNVFENDYNSETISRSSFTNLPRGLEVRIATRNTTPSPLPAGLVTIYAREGDRAQVVGQDRIGFVPAGVELAVSQGRSATLLGSRKIVERTEIDYRDENGNMRERVVTKVEVTLTNRGALPAVAWVRDGIERHGDNRWTLLERSHPDERIGANSTQFKVEVPAKGTTTVTYTVEIR